MDHESLDDLIRRAKKKDPSAFDALVDRFSPRLFGFLFRLTGSGGDAEDLVQEVYLRVVRMIDRYEHDGRFEAWLFRIATNLVRDRARRAAHAPDPRDLERLDRADIRRSAAHPARSGAVLPADDPLESAEDVERLRAALDAVPLPEREVLLLRHFSGLSFKEIAEMMDTPLGTALARAHRGLARLRALLDSDRPLRNVSADTGPVKADHRIHSSADADRTVSPDVSRGAAAARRAVAAEPQRAAAEAPVARSTSQEPRP
jgi:RNA polymerase sigma-70 factor (ECF subfamily)